MWNSNPVRSASGEAARGQNGVSPVGNRGRGGRTILVGELQRGRRPVAAGIGGEGSIDTKTGRKLGRRERGGRKKMTVREHIH
jgi:hypothetical protein